MYGSPWWGEERGKDGRPHLSFFLLSLISSSWCIDTDTTCFRFEQPEYNQNSSCGQCHPTFQVLSSAPFAEYYLVQMNFANGTTQDQIRLLLVDFCKTLNISGNPVRANVTLHSRSRRRSPFTQPTQFQGLILVGIGTWSIWLCVVAGMILGLMLITDYARKIRVIAKLARLRKFSNNQEWKLTSYYKIPADH